MFNQYRIKQLFFFLFISSLVVTVNAQQTSDASYKTNVTEIPDALQRIMQLTPHQFEYNGEVAKQLKSKKGLQYGFITEGVASAFPQLVKERNVNYMFGKNAYRTATIKTVDESALIPVLVASIKQQQAEIEKLKAEVLQLKKQTAFKD